MVTVALIALAVAGSAPSRAQPADPRIAQAQRDHDAAEALWQTGGVEEIDRLLRHALSLREEALGPDHLLVARTRDYLGRNAFNSRRFVEAERHFRDAARITIPQTGELTLDVAYYFGSIGASLREQNRFGLARPYVCHSLAIRQSLLPPGHQLIASSLDNLARIALGEGDVVEARTLLEESQRLYVAAFGSEPPLIRNQRALLDRVRAAAPVAPPFEAVACGPVPTS